VEVGQQQVDLPEAEAGRDEDAVSPLAWPLAAQDSSVRTVVVPTATSRPPRSRSRRSPAASLPALRTTRCASVLGEVLGLHRLEGAGADVQRDAGALHAARFQFGQHAFVEMQGGRRRGHRARHASRTRSGSGFHRRPCRRA
jgi:hypothetical protein